MEKQYIAITTEEVQGIIDLAIARALAAHDDGMVKDKCNMRGTSVPDTIATPVVSPLIPITKACVECGNTKPLDEFGKYTASDDGHDAMCGICRSENFEHVAYQNYLVVLGAKSPDDIIRRDIDPWVALDLLELVETARLLTPRSGRKNIVKRALREFIDTNLDEIQNNIERWEKKYA